MKTLFASTRMPLCQPLILNSYLHCQKAAGSGINLPVSYRVTHLPSEIYFCIWGSGRGGSPPVFASQQFPKMQIWKPPVPKDSYKRYEKAMTELSLPRPQNQRSPPGKNVGNRTPPCLSQGPPWPIAPPVHERRAIQGRAEPITLCSGLPGYKSYLTIHNLQAGPIRGRNPRGASLAGLPGTFSTASSLTVMASLP